MRFYRMLPHLASRPQPFVAIVLTPWASALFRRRLLQPWIPAVQHGHPFCRRGLSNLYGFPIWTTFLLEQAALAGIVPPVKWRIKNGQFEEAAADLLHARGVYPVL